MRVLGKEAICVSSKTKKELLELSNNATDYITSAVKSAFGVIPIAGPAAQELLGIIIPNQRMDRVVRFIELLGAEFEILHEQVEMLLNRMKGSHYSSLFYKACVGSADSLNSERINYIKNIFVYGLQQDDLQIYKAEGLLNLLNRITDIEVVYLRFYYLLNWDVTQAKEYQEKTGIQFFLPIIEGGMTREELDNEVAKGVYLNNLVNYGLLEIKRDKKGKGQYKCSSIGDLLIRTIDKVL